MAQASNNAPRAPGLSRGAAGMPARPGAPTPASEAGRPLRWSPRPGFFALGAPVAALALLIVGAALQVPANASKCQGQVLPFAPRLPPAYGKAQVRRIWGAKGKT